MTTKKAAAAATRDTAAINASLRKLQSQKTRADADLAYADKLVANAKTDQARAKATELQAKVAPKAAELATQLDAAKADSKSKLDDAAAAKDAAKTAAAKKADLAKTALDAKLAVEPVSVYISRATQKIYVRRNTHKPWPDGGEVFDFSIEAPITIRDPDQADRHPYFHGDGAQRFGRPALERGHDRQWRQRQGRARPHHHPAGGARSDRADRLAEILDRHLG